MIAREKVAKLAGKDLREYLTKPVSVALLMKQENKKKKIPSVR